MEELIDAVELCKCQHLYLRGNFQQDMFFDEKDKINVWNRLWLSAYATGVHILSAVILENHLHISALIQDDDQRTSFKRYFRMSITQYHNRRYNVHGMLGMRMFNHAVLHDVEDLRDCICYHIRNVLHHKVEMDFWNYPYSTAKYVFNLASGNRRGIYTCRTVPEKLLNDYLPARESLPLNWKMTKEGMIVPPPEVFRADMVEAIFERKSELYLETLLHKTTREADDSDELGFFTVQLRNNGQRKNLDELVVDFVKANYQTLIPSMTMDQKMEAIALIKNKMPNAKTKTLARLFAMPYSTLWQKLQILRS